VAAARRPPPRLHSTMHNIAFLLLAAQALHARQLTSEPLISREVIVGRAACGGVTWLLTDVPQLIRIGRQGPTVSSSSLRGLQKDEKPWGLACLPGDELWTLAGSQALVRLDARGAVVERLPLDRPRLGIFSTGTRLVLQDPPSSRTRPLLASGLPRTLSAFVPWPSPLSQPAATREEVLHANLVNCGIAAAEYVPCWLATGTRLTISDGSVAHTTVQDLRFVRTGPHDESTPIWDVALAGESRVWVLASARTGHATPPQAPHPRSACFRRGGLFERNADPAQIGRASCRERV